MAVPQYMQKGSKGHHVTILHAFLCGFYLGTGIVVIDTEYDKVTAEKVFTLQKYLGLEADGNFGPETRAAVKERFKFDFDAACETIPCVTEFIQPDGSVISWWPGSAEKLAVRPGRLGLDLSAAEMG